MIDNLALFKKGFDIYLKNFLNKKIEQIRSYTKDQHIINYINHANKIALSGGKRIRPFIAYLSYCAFGGKEKNEAIKLLISIEIFHIFCLIHDDIMDKDSMRHGLQTSHSYIADKLKKERGNKNCKHFGNSQAILLGDLFFNWSSEIINLNSDFNESITKKVRKMFSEMVEGTIIGQMLDIESKSLKNISKDLTYEINYLKTAKYSFIYPLLIGACLSGNLTDEIYRFCNELGLNLGIVFQAQDDIFDLDNKFHIESQKELITNNITNAHT